MKDQRQRVQVPLDVEQHALLRAAVDSSGVPAATMARQALMREVRRRLRLRGELAHALERSRASAKRRGLVTLTATAAVNIVREKSETS